MEEYDAIALIKSFIPMSTETKEIQLLVHDLGRLPLALAQAGAYIKKNEPFGCSVLEYRQRYKRTVELLGKGLPEGAHSLPVAVTWDITLEAIIQEAKLKNEVPLALHLLMACAYLSPEAIPQSLLKTWFENVCKELKIKSEFSEVVNQLWSYSMINLDKTGNVTVHRLVQAVLRHQHQHRQHKHIDAYPALTPEWYEHLLISIHKKFTSKTQILEDENRDKLLLPHMQMLERHYRILGFNKNTMNFACLLFDMGHVYFNLLGNAKDAQIKCEESLEIVESADDMVAFDIATLWNTLGNVYHEIGDFKKAEELLKKAVQKDGLDPERLAESLLNLSNVCLSMGNVKKQLEILEKAYQCIENKKHTSIHAQILMNLGIGYLEIGDFLKALNYLNKSYELKVAIYDKDHPEVVKVLNNLGSVYVHLDKGEEALSCLKKALEINENKYDKYHIKVAQVLVELGRSDNLHISLEGVKGYLKRALAIYKKHYGKKDYILAKDYVLAILLNNLCAVYRKLMKYQKSLTYGLKALEVVNNCYPKNHFRRAPILTSLGNIYNQMGNKKEAQNKYEESLEICKLHYGDEHPETAIVLTNLGSLFNKMENASKAETLLIRAIEIYRSHLGNMGSNLAIALNSLGNTRVKQKNYSDARNLFEEALTLYAENDPQIANTLLNLAPLCIMTGDNIKARKLYEQALGVQQKFYDKEDMEIITILYEISYVSLRLGDFSHAKDLLEKRVLPIYKRNYEPGNQKIIQAENLLSECNKQLSRMQQKLDQAEQKSSKEQLGDGKASLVFASLPKGLEKRNITELSELIKVLEQYKNEKDGKDLPTPELVLRRAAAAGKIEVIKTLLKLVKDIDINQPGPSGKTAIVFAKEHNKMEVVEFLINVGAKYEVKETTEKKKLSANG